MGLCRKCVKEGAGASDKYVKGRGMGVQKVRGEGCGPEKLTWGWGGGLEPPFQPSPPPLKRAPRTRSLFSTQEGGEIFAPNQMRGGKFRCGKFCGAPW